MVGELQLNCRCCIEGEGMLGKELVGKELVLRLGKGPGRKEEDRLLLVFVGPLLRGFV